MDPYLQYQPPFSYSLPIQLLVLGITFTLLLVLGIQLLFTTQYHYPLAPLNYVLQLFSILSVLISVLIKIIVVLQYSASNADTWPYSLDYVAVSIPPSTWSIGQDGAWFLLQALNSGLANITHIQFLTLLYPSVTEVRLIVFVLGPLALASSALTFTALSDNQTTLDLGDAIRNVFNSTLLLIFTIALGLWGLFVNRRRAWRSDGGTAVFGIGAIFLAIVSTSFNFVAVREDGIDWLQHLLYAAILWQMWLGWWWWVGSGMGIGEVEDIMERAERKKRKLAKRAARKRADANSRSKSGVAPGVIKRTTTMASVSELGQASANAVAGFTSSVTGILRGRNGTLSRRHTSQHDEAENGQAGRDQERENIELDDMGHSTTSANNRINRSDTPSQTARRQGTTTPQVGFSASTYSGSRNQISTNSESSSTSNTPSLHAPHSVGQFISYPANWLWVYLRRLRRAHEDAAKKQALERAELRQRVFATSSSAGHQASNTVAGGGGTGAGTTTLDLSLARGGLGEEEVGWGLGRFGIREHEESARRIQAAGERLRDERLLGNSEEGRSRRASAGDGTTTPKTGHSRRESKAKAREPDLDNPITAGEGDLMNTGEASGTSTRREAGDSTRAEVTNPRARPGHRRRDSARDTGSEWEDIEESSGSSSDERSNRRRNGRGGPRRENDDSAGRRTGWSWWGPLREWRLADRTVF